MIQRVLHRLPVAVLAIAVSFTATASHAAFFSIHKDHFSAAALLGGGAPAGQPAFTITALPLANQVFSGKHFVIPMQIVSHTGSISTTGLRIAVVYQLSDSSGNPLNGSTPQAV